MDMARQVSAAMKLVWTLIMQSQDKADIQQQIFRQLNLQPSLGHTLTCTWLEECSPPPPRHLICLSLLLSQCSNSFSLVGPQIQLPQRCAHSMQRAGHQQDACRRRRTVGSAATATTAAVAAASAG